ncbi:MAG TPA: peptidylprolyl isomerase, partial [Roseivirga sp.]
MNSFQSTIALTILGLTLICAKAKSQVVATIDDTYITADELLYAFNKNRNKGTPIILDSLETYLEQYINFKLKVRAARKLGLDTPRIFQEELKGYLSQIKKPYLENPEAEEAIIRETYNRMKIDINASHILIKVAPTANPQDTLKAFQFLDSLRNTIESKQEFEKMARQYSQDGSAQLGGNLGWFTAMHMVAPFEDGAYNTAVGQVSEIVRSSFGYHLIYVNDRRENKGKVKTSHIFFTKQRGSQAARLKALEVYDSLERGSNWVEMVRKYSDDQGTREDAGRLPWAGLKQLPDEFLAIAYSIDSIGKYSEPAETQYG